VKISNYKLPQIHLACFILVEKQLDSVDFVPIR